MTCPCSSPPKLGCHHPGAASELPAWHFSNRTSQVGSRTGARTVGRGFPAALFRLCRGVTVPSWSRFQLPPRQTERAAFPHSAFL